MYYYDVFLKSNQYNPTTGQNGSITYQSNTHTMNYSYILNSKDEELSFSSLTRRAISNGLTKFCRFSRSDLQGKLGPLDAYDEFHTFGMDETAQIFPNCAGIWVGEGWCSLYNSGNNYTCNRPKVRCSLDTDNSDKYNQNTISSACVVLMAHVYNSGNRYSRNYPKVRFSLNMDNSDKYNQSLSPNKVWYTRLTWPVPLVRISKVETPT